ncbi:unnamed protein product [Dibothriocephalus latus]|uniref:Tubulin/FtsZ GTPase domain-containing protein n=1 Tax=Dibothriocephalus latus TaxID=60516 RepID=A0A3P7NN31_DIBLA|nr:unnamed protein product [Dibothriocephalus latus]
MREIIALHMGQAGVQLGHAIWELACLEHCVSPTGEFNAACGDGPPSEGLESVFLECRNGNYCPRALLLDLEPTVIV